ncbi:type IV secretion system protein VirD4 [Variovorax sp. OK605]|jgi:type IV secretion system protein VirD4|uniref:type IV secretory system conjugative DNA transfer family protein n=1 Tax=Variovorax sp. OK605 TaxID=1855317 RepID=UPI0008F0F739|nr:type IV secretory system conjugative DNA transfer family protein [Variovorax sp. OK605]SFQ32980.1 type IV secretion system protein VirD4 [Variovorax sp. OK605]
MTDVLTRGLEGGDTRLATARWLRGEELTQMARDKDSEFYFSTGRQRGRPSDLGTIYLGQTEEAGGKPLGWCDDRHLVTVAGSRAGKGRSAIVPNLLLYPGSVICIDPKGENARATAQHRAKVLKQDVFILDPFGSVGPDHQQHLAYFDPLAVLDPGDPELHEKIALIADAIVVVAPDAKEPHFDDTARALIGALIGHVLTEPALNRPRTLITVRELLMEGDSDAAQRFSEELLANDEGTLYGAHDGLFIAMQRNTALNGMISGQAQLVLFMGTEERGSVLSTTDRHTKFLEGRKMPMVLAKSLTRARLDLSRLKRDKRPITVYLCLKPRYMATHARWLRLMISAIIAAVDEVSEAPASGYRILAILDEFPVLGYLRSIETAVGYIAGYGLQIWTVLQDLSQLRRDYPASWETFLGNAGMKQFFGNTDHTTLEYIAKSLGETELEVVTRNISQGTQAQREHRKGETKTERMFVDADSFRSVQHSHQLQKVALLTPGEIAIVFRRSSGRQLLLSAETPPIVGFRCNYDELQARRGIESLLSIA